MTTDGDKRNERSNQVVEANRRQSPRFGLTDRGDPIRLAVATSPRRRPHHRRSTFI